MDQGQGSNPITVEHLLTTYGEQKKGNDEPETLHTSTPKLPTAKRKGNNRRDKPSNLDVQASSPDATCLVGTWLVPCLRRFQKLHLKLCRIK